MWAGAAIGAACGYFGAGIANIATSAMGISIVTGVGTGVGASAAGSWGGSLITPLEGALITGTEFAIGGFAAGLASGYAGGKGSVGDMFSQAGIGAAIGFGTGFGVGYSYTTGWQSVLHGADTVAHNAKVIEAQRIRIANMMAMLDEAREGKGLLGQIETQRLIVNYHADPTPEALARQVRIAILEHSGPEARAFRRYKTLRNALSFIHSMLSQEEHNLGDDLQWEMWDYMTREDGAIKRIEERENIYVPRKQKMLLEIWGDLIKQFCD